MKIKENPVEWKNCVAFLIINDNKLLVEKRTHAFSFYPDAIAIPGGHEKPGETTEEALNREAEEELGIIITGSNYICSLLDKEPEIYRIHYYYIKSWSGQISCYEAESLHWIPVNEFEKLDLEVDKTAVKEYIRIYGT